MFCVKCGNQLTDGAAFCPKCGTAASVPQMPEPTHQAAPAETVPAVNFAQAPAVQKGAWQHFTGAFKKYAVFAGRARRAEYWWFFFFSMLCGIAALIIGNYFSLHYQLGGQLVNIPQAVLYWLFLCPSMSVAVRRMHDCDKSGWFALIPVYNIILCFTAGTPGPNRFGPDPKTAA